MSEEARRTEAQKRFAAIKAKMDGKNRGNR